MTTNHYEWNWGGPLPTLLRHSEVKHSLLHDYLVDYFLTLTVAPGQEQIKLTIVDGFCGGGRYVSESGTIVRGSPIVILKSLEEASARLHLEKQRRKPVEFNVELLCVDDDPKAIEHLKHVFADEGYGDKVRDGSIQFITAEFASKANDILKEVQRRTPKAGRAIYLLDQYGYDQVPSAPLKAIFKELKFPEVILTFYADSLINFLSKENLANFERKTGFTGEMPAKFLDKGSKTPGWRRFVQANLYQRLVQNSGAPFFTPFFIRPERGHGDYWLVHLSKHWKARDVMTATHWRHHNHFIHYGGAGFDMLSTGYAARIDDEDRPQSGFQFDDLASQKSQTDMSTQIPGALATHRGGVSFEEFFLARINTTPATADMIKSTILQLVRDKEIQVVGSDGAIRNVRTSIQKEHVLRLPAQKAFSFTTRGGKSVIGKPSR